MHDAPTDVHQPPARRWSTVAWIACSVLLVGLVVGVWFKVDADRSGANLANAIITGERPVAPALPTRGIEDDGAPGLPSWYRSDDAGTVTGLPGAQVVVVNWWASWCGPCKEEAPVLRDVANDYRGDVTVVGVNAGSQDLERDARAFVLEHDLGDLSIVRGNRADEDAWGVGTAFPQTFVIGADGRLSSFVNGPVDDETLRGLVDAELEAERS